MNADQMNQIKEQAEALSEKIGDVLHDNDLRIVQIVLARFYCGVCIDTGMSKKRYIEACEALWDALMEDYAEEIKH